MRKILERIAKYGDLLDKQGRHSEANCVDGLLRHADVLMHSLTEEKQEIGRLADIARQVASGNKDKPWIEKVRKLVDYLDEAKLASVKREATIDALELAEIQVAKFSPSMKKAIRDIIEGLESKDSSIMEDHQQFEMQSRSIVEEIGRIRNLVADQKELDDVDQKLLLRMLDSAKTSMKDKDSIHLAAKKLRSVERIMKKKGPAGLASPVAAVAKRCKYLADL